MAVVRLSFFLIVTAISLCIVSGALAKPTMARAAAAKLGATPEATAKPTLNVDWEVIKVGARDYLSADNIARFYHLAGDINSTGKNIVLNDGRRQLRLTLDSREAIINGVRNWLSFPVASQNGKLLVSRVDLAKTIEPQLRPQMIQRPVRVQTIVLDAGHGGFDKGARSPFGTEKEYALDMVRRLRPLLQDKGFKVVLTRESDVFVPLQMRAQIANQTRDSIFVSMHFNATSNREATGFEIFSLTPRGAPSTADSSVASSFAHMQAGNPVDVHSFELSVSVYHSMLGHFPEIDRGIKRARFAVLRLSKIPAILIEGGFLSEASDSKRVADPAWRGKLAEAIAVGIENYRDVIEKKQRPMFAADYRAQEISDVTVLNLVPTPIRIEDSPAPNGIFEFIPDLDPDREP